MRKEKIIIFDFDGVIADSFEIAFGINKISRPKIKREDYRRLFDGNIYDAEFEEPADKEIDFWSEYGKRFKALGINPDVKLVVKKLRENFDLFIVSSTTEAIIKEYLEKQKLQDCFVEILGYNTETSKVKKFKMIFKKYRISPAESIFITDTSGDIKEAKEAKINFIVGILGGYQSRQSLDKAAPDAIVKNFNDFYRIIRES